MTEFGGNKSRKNVFPAQEYRKWKQRGGVFIGWIPVRWRTYIWVGKKHYRQIKYFSFLVINNQSSNATNNKWCFLLNVEDQKNDLAIHAQPETDLTSLILQDIENAPEKEQSQLANILIQELENAPEKTVRTVNLRKAVRAKREINKDEASQRPGGK